MTLATVTFDASDYGGVDFDARRTKVYATNSTEDGVIVDVLANHQYLGSAQGTISGDGTGSITVPAPSTGTIPETWQTTIHFDYPDRNSPGGRGGESFGPFTITGTTRTVSNKALTSNVATLTTSAPHGLEVGNSITVTGVDSTFNGTYTIASVPSSTTLTYAKTATNVTSAAATGTLTSPNVRLGDLIEEMPVLPTYASTVLDRLDGIQDHGNVSGAVEINPATAIHVLDATAATVLTLGSPPGNTVTVYVASGADDVTVTGLEDVTLTDGGFATFVFVRGAWVLASSGAASEPVVTDSTAPSNVSGLVATGGVGQVSLSWTAATDAESTVHYAYRVYLTSGGPSGAYANTTSTGATVTGLAAGTYSAQVYAYSTGGASTIATSTSVTVTAALVTFFQDDFARADGAMIPTKATPLMGSDWTADSALSSVQLSGGKLTTADTVVYSPTTSAGREITADVSSTSGAGYVTIGCYSDAYIKATLKGNGQVEFGGTTGNAIVNASGGTNTYTPAGYITGLNHTLKLVTDAGIASIYVDNVLILQAAYSTTLPVKRVFVRVGTGAFVDNVVAKA